MRWFIALLAICWAYPAAAQVTSGDLIIGRGISRGDVTGSSFTLCDGADANDTDCPEVDLINDLGGVPWFAIIHIDAIGTCTGNVTVRHYSVSDTGSPDKRDLGVLTIGGVEELQVDGPFLDRFIDVDLTNLAVCVADEFDVAIQMRFRKERR